MLASSIRSVVLSAAVAALAVFGAGCYAELPPPETVDDGYYSPMYTDDGYVVYYDTGGRPYYYNGGRTYYISSSNPRYRSYTYHYNTYGRRYHRWYHSYGTRYRGYRSPRYYRGRRR
jgi:hypothetical protein